MANETGSGPSTGTRIKSTTNASKRRNSIPQATSIDHAAVSRSIASLSKLGKTGHMSIEIGEHTYHVNNAPNGAKATVLSVTRSDGYTIMRTAWTSSGSYGYAITATKREAIKEAQNELKRIADKYKNKAPF